MRPEASEDFEMFSIRPAPVSPQENKSNPTQDCLFLESKLARCGAREGPASMKKQFFLERECTHRDSGIDGEVYNGVFFVKALQRLQSNEALKLAAKISPFYWVDAPRVMVWLCRQCAV